MTTRTKREMNRFMLIGARIPIDVARKFKSILAARGEFFVDWLERMAKAEIDGIILLSVGQHGAPRQNAAPVRKEATREGPPGE